MDLARCLTIRAMFAALFSDLPQHATLGRLARLRLFALLCQSLGLLLAQFFLGIHLPLFALGAVLLLGFAFLLWTIWRMQRPQALGASGLFAQLLLDVLNWSAMLYLCGGATNPFVSFYLAILAVAAAILPSRWVVLLAALSLLAYSLLSYFYLPLQLADSEQAVNYHLAGMWVNFALSAIVISWFVTRISATLRQRDAQLAQARERQLQQAQVLALGMQAASSAHLLSTPLSTIAVLIGELSEEARSNPSLAAFAEDFALIDTQLKICQQGLAKMRNPATSPPQDALATQPKLALLAYLQEFVTQWRLQHPQQQLQFALANDQQINCSDEITWASQQALAQILPILLDNAYKAAPTCVAKLWLSREETRWRLQVQDQGTGFAPDLLPRLGHAPVASSTGGQGIGLWLATLSSHQIGGQLRLRNVPQQGALVELEWPC